MHKQLPFISISRLVKDMGGENVVKNSTSWKTKSSRIDWLDEFKLLIWIQNLGDDVKSRDNDSVSYFSTTCLNVFLFFLLKHVENGTFRCPPQSTNFWMMNEQNFIALWKSSESYPRAKGYPPYNLMKGNLFIDPLPGDSWFMPKAVT